jgi:hypothetical protein
MKLIFKSGYPARVVRVASVSLYRNFSKKILYGGKAYNPYNPYRLLPVGSPLSSTSFRQSIRGSPGTELRNWASVLTVTSVQLCVKRLLARILSIHRPFYEQSSSGKAAKTIRDMFLRIRKLNRNG